MINSTDLQVPLNKDIQNMMLKRIKRKNTLMANNNYPPLKSYSGKGRKQTVIENTLYEYFSSRLQTLEDSSLKSVNGELENILIGVCRLNWYKPSGKQNNLSYKALLKILSCLQDITNERIQYLLGVEYRQANRYMKAIQLALPYMSSINTNTIHNMSNIHLE